MTILSKRYALVSGLTKSLTGSDGCNKVCPLLPRNSENIFRVYKGIHFQVFGTVDSCVLSGVKCIHIQIAVKCEASVFTNKIIIYLHLKQS